MTSSPSSPVCLLPSLEASNPQFATNMSPSDPTQSHADIQAKLKHHLWQKTKQVEVEGDDEEPHFYKLRISVLRDGEAVGDCPPRTFVCYLSFITFGNLVLS